MSTKRRTPGVFASFPPRDEQGKKLCRNCHGPLKKQNQHNCSPKCVQEWAAKTSPQIMRRRIFERDRGVCAICRVDTDAQKREYRKLHTRQECEEYRKRVGVPAGRVDCGEWWDADHIVPVIEGGGECGVEGYRTLCIPCHKAETKALRGRMANREREKRAIENDKAGMFADQVGLPI
jgi:5-methylcytosine-specific restriction protein A